MTTTAGSEQLSNCNNNSSGGCNQHHQHNQNCARIGNANSSSDNQIVSSPNFEIAVSGNENIEF